MVMADWAADPELVATFYAEVDDRLTSMREAVLALEQNPGSRKLVAGLLRDAHTVKGSAHMLGLDAVVRVAHRTENLLGALRDGRLAVRSELVDLLLTAADGISGAMPGAAAPVDVAALEVLCTALDAAATGTDPVVAPRAGPMEPAESAEPAVPAAPAVRAAVSPTTNASMPSSAQAGASVRVPTTRVHDLLDVVGEAELDGRRVERRVQEISALAATHLTAARVLRSLPTGADSAPVVAAMVAAGDQIQVAARELRGHVEESASRLAQVRDGAMGLAMVPVRRVVAAFPRLVREVASSTGHQAQLVLEGEDVELDARVLDGVADALRHLVINAVDHGCEPPSVRVAAGKPQTATVTVSAQAAGGAVVIEVADDGAGIDRESLRAAAVRRGLLTAAGPLSDAALLETLFAPGFSTRDEVTETSGRGVGLDVVRAAAEGLGGSVEVSSQAGFGTRFVMTLPVTLGVIRCLLARVGEEHYALPLPGVVETVSLRSLARGVVAGTPVLVRGGSSLPLLDLGEVLAVPGPRDPKVAVVVRYGGSGEQLAWSVDALDGELELVVKDLGTFLGRLPAVGGATIDGDGRVVLLLDLRELAATRVSAGAAAAPLVPPPAPSPVPGQRSGPAGRDDAPTGPARVLVVEDSLGVRELERVILESAGYDVTTAVDGTDGAARLVGEPFELILSDVEMPGMDGFTLTRRIRATSGWEQVPVVIMTSRGDDSDRRAGLDAGADAYLLKSEFDQQSLVDTVRRLVGR